nr:hypothetical protein [Tanacetum cinerariifolium]
MHNEIKENLVTYSPAFQNTSEPSNASTSVVNAPREPYVVKQDNGSFVDEIIFDLNRAPDSPNQFHCFHCKDVLRDGEACKRCTCAKCGSGQPRVVREETYVNTTLENRKLLDAEAEAIHMILNGIGNDIYSTLDACPTAIELWLAIKRLQQRESINKQDVKINLF